MGVWLLPTGSPARLAALQAHELFKEKANGKFGDIGKEAKEKCDRLLKKAEKEACFQRKVPEQTAS